MADENASEAPQTTDDLLREVLEEQRAHRAEVAALRSEVNAKKQPPPVVPVNRLTAEEQLVARMEEIGQHSHYCPGCGLLYDYQQKCTGKAESPHPPVEVVSIDELKSGDPSQHSAAVYVTA